MAKVDGGELLIRTLRRAGVEVLFTLHGGHLDAILQAAARAGLRLVDTRHEQAAAHAADGWARTTGKPGVAVVTAGPGVTDAVTGVANAYLDCVPMLLIGGAAPLRDAETLPLQGGLDQVAMLTPITKWAHRITHTERIPDLVAQALRVAVAGRPGPVFLEVPIDVLFASVDEDRAGIPQRFFPEAAPAPSEGALAKATDWFLCAERPAILAGGGAWFSDAASALLELAERIRVPVFANSKARGLVPAGHPLDGGSFGNLGVLTSMAAGPDLVMLLGARIGLFTGGASGRVIPGEARVIQVDIAGEEIGRNRDVDLGIVADCRELVEEMGRAARGTDWPAREEWLQQVAQVRASPRALFAEALATSKAPIHPFRLAAAITEAVSEDTVIVADGGETSTWMEMAAEIRRPGGYLSHGYLGCLGTGLPFAIAAQVAHPQRRVVCIIGDGSVGLNFAELDTMARHGLPIVVVVNNDQLWGMSAHGQDLLYGKEQRVVTELGPTRYDLAAAGFDCYAEQVIEPEDLIPALKRALDAGRPALLNVMTDPDVISPVTVAMVGEATEGEPDASSAEATKVQIPYYDDLS